MKILISIISLFLLSNCGGGPLPSKLLSRKIITDTLFPQKKLLLQQDTLGLVGRIFHYKDAGFYAAVGHNETCLFRSHGEIIYCNYEISNLGLSPKITTTKTGYKLDINGDSYIEWLTAYKDGFLLKDASGDYIGLFKPPKDYWYKAAVSSSEPHIVLVSTDELLFVLDNNLKKLTKLKTPGIEAPLHVIDGALYIDGSKKYIISLFTGRGGWHRSILFIHDMNGNLIYHEVLDRYMSIMPIHNDKMHGFMLGGHNQILLYLL